MHTSVVVHCLFLLRVEKNDRANSTNLPNNSYNITHNNYLCYRPTLTATNVNDDDDDDDDDDVVT